MTAITRRRALAQSFGVGCSRRPSRRCADHVGGALLTFAGL
jgi:hypothetical protein